MLVYILNHSSALDHLGGAERSLIKLVEDWREIDPEFEPFFITKAPVGQFVAAIEKRGWKYEALRFRGWAISKFPLPQAELAYFAREDYAATSRMVELMEKRRPDLVVTNTVVSPWAAFAAKVHGIPHAWFVREYGDLDHRLIFEHGRENAFADIALLSERIFANSYAIKAHIQQYAPEAKVSVIYPQLDLDRLADRAASDTAIVPFPHDDPALKITVVGRLAPSKGQWRVVEAVGDLHRRGIRANVCFVGAKMRAEQDTQLLKRARKLGVADQIVFAGERSNPFPYVAAADVCVTPSSNEAFGRTTLEYLSLGKPVLATRAGGSTELVDDGVNGFLFDADDPSTLADKLALYAQDPALIARHGAAAKKAVARVSAKEHGNATAVAQLTALATRPGPVYRLPAIAATWFTLPGLVSANPGNGITLSYLLSRLGWKIRGFLRHPISAVRHRLQS